MRNLLNVYFGAFIVNFEEISHIAFVFSVSTFNKQMQAGQELMRKRDFVLFLGLVISIGVPIGVLIQGRNNRNKTDH